ncbi:hypothetical protein D3C72_1220980 [compost metagenome]
MDQRRRHRRIHAAGQAQNDFLVTHLLADLGHGFGDMVAHHPVGLRAGNLEHEALEHLAALCRMRDFRVELHRVIAARLVGHAGDRAARRGRHQLEARRQFGHLVAMAHPDLEHAVALGRREILDAIEQPGMTMGAHLGVAEFAMVAPLHLAAQLHGHGLHAVADAQHRHAEVPHGLRRAQLVVFVGAGVAAGQDDGLRRVLADEFVGHIVRMDFAVDVCLANAAGNQLRDLRAEIKDEDFVVHDGRLAELPARIRA